MKSSKKVLAFALAAAMVVTAVPATNAQAASTAKLSAKKATVYSEGYKTVTVKTPKSWKSVKVTATSNKKSVAKVKKTAAKKIKVTGVKPGTAKVTVKVTYKTSTKKNAKAKTKKLTYTLKVAKVGVALSGDSVVAIGNTTKLTNTKKNSSRAKITYTSSDDSIATVAADGTVTGVKAGKVTITAKITVGKDSATTTKDVEVKNYVLSTVAQNKLTELTATVAGNTKNLKTTDFTVKNTTSNVVYPVSKVSVDSKDATKVTLTLFSELSDGANYDVTLDGTTKSFKASDGKVASIALDNATIPYATETEVKLVSKDANGVVLKELKTTDADAHYPEQFQYFIYMPDFRWIIRDIILMLSFLNKEICHDFKITVETADLLFCKPCDLKYFHFIIIDVLFQSFRDFHQPFDILFAIPVMIRTEVQYNCHDRQDLFSVLQ